MDERIAIVGRPNVGKSTLFNRLTRGDKAIVDDRPGVTRDRREGKGSLADLEFQLIDTAGLEDAVDGSLEKRMRLQTERAIADSELTLLVFDARAGITTDDTFFAREIRKSSVKVIMVGNKCEGRAGDAGLSEAWQLGFGQPIGISAAHGEGLSDLYDAIVEMLPKHEIDSEVAEENDPETGVDAGVEIDPETDPEIDPETETAAKIDMPLRIAVIGRPNMGKSTLINHLVGSERVLTGPEAGITRDAIEIPFHYDDRELLLYDTAGVRRKARIEDVLEKAMVDDSLRAVRFAHVCILLIDAREPLNKQDLALARLVADEGRAMVIAANMWDVASDRQNRLKDLKDRLEKSLGQVKGIPLIPISALKGSGVTKMMRSVLDVYTRWNYRVSTAGLNRWLENMLESHPPPLVQGRRIRIRYATQIKTRPPTFALFVSRPDDLPDHYLRYLAAGLRDDFDLQGLPLRLVMRKGKNPYIS